MRSSSSRSEGSHNEIAKVDSEGEKEVSEDVVDGLVCDDRMWMTVAGRGSRNGLVGRKETVLLLGGGVVV